MPHWIPILRITKFIDMPNGLPPKENTLFKRVLVSIAFIVVRYQDEPFAFNKKLLFDMLAPYRSLLSFKINTKMVSFRNAMNKKCTRMA